MKVGIKGTLVLRLDVSGWLDRLPRTVVAEVVLGVGSPVLNMSWSGHEEIAVEYAADYGYSAADLAGALDTALQAESLGRGSLRARSPGEEGGGELAKAAAALLASRREDVSGGGCVVSRDCLLALMEALGNEGMHPVSRAMDLVVGVVAELMSDTVEEVRWRVHDDWARLGLDSLDRVELLMRIEDRLGVNLDDDVARTLETPMQLVDKLLEMELV